jgi:hypothetical protein
MSNREVAGLQALAQKHGGQLSVNPDTGLPEAGFLDNILPAVAGAGLAYFGVNPMMAAGIVGGISALDSKDLSKGLVAGLGAYGGGSMYTGLAGAGLGAVGADLSANAAANAAGQGLTGEAYNQAVQNEVAAQLAEKNLASEGVSQLFSNPGQTLATMGGGSMLQGGLPILAGLAPAAVEAFDAEDEDKPPEQHKGYIRKYALDPVTGQYKQVGVYEAGGDPNVDVTAKAGTAGAYGAVGQSEYEAAQGMAAGGTTDSSRIYDYLMGRGPNPMQFTRAAAPAATVTPTPPVAPITPTTPILEEVYDPYGNRVHEGGNYDAEKHQEQLNAVNDYLNVNNDKMTLNKYFDLSPEKRADLDARAAKASPIRYTIGEVVKLAAPGRFAAEGLQALGSVFKNMFKPNVVLDKTYAPVEDIPPERMILSPEAQLREFERNSPAGRLGPDAGAGAASPSGPPSGSMSGSPPPSGERGGSQSGGGYGGGAATGGGYGEGGGRDASGGGDRGTRGGFAQGGISNLHQYNLGSYSDGGRLLKGPGDGVSDDIPATIGNGQPARLADGEFVIPARIVSELGNGSTDAGARALYKMMDRIQAGRRKTVGKDQVAKNSKSARHLPA